MDATYSNHLKNSKPLTKEEEKESSVEKLITSNLRLVVSIAGRYVGRGLDLQDLIQEGNTGLIIAANNFDISKDCKFSTYATYWIKQKILAAISDHGKTIRTPSHINELNTKILSLLNMQRTISEIAEELEVDQEKINNSLNALNIQPLSLDYLVDQYDGYDFIVQSDEKTAEDDIIFHEKNLLVREALSVLSEREHSILSLRFGLDDGEEKSLKEIGEIYGITQERIRQIEARALKKIKKSYKNKELKNYTGE